MTARIIRKLLVVLIMLVPAVSYSGCKKQAKCGCDGDVLFTLDKTQARVYFNDTGTNITFTTLSDPYSSYYFCNPGEMFPKLSESKSGDILLVSGTAYWECNYLYQQSNSGYGYGSYYKVYMVQVTELVSDMYGK